MAYAQNGRGAPTRTRTVAVWLAKGLLAAAFLTAGTLKLVGNPHMVAVFDQVGLGQWFRYLTGALELAGVLAIFIPPATVVGAAMLCVTMAGAIFCHLFLIDGSPLPAAVLFALAAFVLLSERRRAMNDASAS